MIAITVTPFCRETLLRRALAATVCIALGVAAVVHGMKASGDSSAIVRWRGLLDHLVRGDNVYNEPGIDGSFPYPPVFGLALWPLTLLPPVVAAMLWFALKVVLAAVAIHWSIRLATGDEFALPLRATAVLLVLVSRPLLSDLAHGNVNIVILFLVTAGLWAYRHGRDSFAGLAIALATAFKVTPALSIPYFAWKREWRVVAWSGVGLVLFLVIVPSPMLGFTRNVWLLRSWANAMVRPYVIEGKVETLQVNQSLPGIWMRLVTESPGLAPGDAAADEFARPVNLLSLDRTLALWLLKGMIIAILAWVAWLSRAPTADHGDRGDRRLAAEFALVFIAMLLVSERSWKHHFVTMTLPFAVLVAEFVRTRLDRSHRLMIAASLAASFLLMASTSSELGGWLAGGAGHKYAQAYGMFGACAAVTLIAISRVLTHSHPREPLAHTNTCRDDWA